MATTTTLGDVTLVTATQSESSPLVEHFRSVVSEVAEADTNPLEALGITYLPIPGKTTQVPVEEGVFSPRTARIGGDQSIAPLGQKAPRVEIEWFPRYLEISIADGESEQNQLRWVDMATRRLKAAAMRLDFQVCADACRSRFTAGGTTAAARVASIAFRVDPRTKRSGQYGEGSRVITGAATAWNFQKAASARSAAAIANLAQYGPARCA